MFAVGNGELCALIPDGARVKCKRHPNCRKHPKSHAVEYGKDITTGRESRMLAVYTCGRKSYICGIAGRLLPGEELADA